MHSSWDKEGRKEAKTDHKELRTGVQIKTHRGTIWAGMLTDHTVNTIYLFSDMVNFYVRLLILHYAFCTWYIMT